MSSILGKHGENRINPVLKQLANDRRRQILELLQEQQDAMAEKELARRLAGAEQDEPAETSTVDAVRRVRIQLAHVDLPALDDAALVAWDDVEGTVRAVDHPLFRDPAFDRVLQLEDEELNATFECLADGRRRDVLVVLDAHERAIPRRALAHEVLAREGETDPADAVESAVHSLHHVHLPKLESAGLVAYDRDADAVSSTELAELVTSWIEANESESSADSPHWLASSLG